MHTQRLLRYSRVLQDIIYYWDSLLIKPMLYLPQAPINKVINTKSTSKHVDANVRLQAYPQIFSHQ